MGIFSFFEQIGNLISSIVDMVIFVFQSITSFFVAIGSGFTYMNLFVGYLPGELRVGFVILMSISLIYLIVGR